MSQPNNQKPPTNSMKKQYKMKNRYARVVRFGDIRHKLPTKLKISPVAMIPHKKKGLQTYTVPLLSDSFETETV